MAINSPYAPGDPYSYDLKWMVRKLKELSSAANTAAEAAAALVTTQVVINCDTGAGTAVIDTDLTWDELIETAQRGKLLCQLKLSNEADTTKRPFCYPNIYKVLNQQFLDVSDISANGIPISRINADKAQFINSKSGSYERAYVSV